MGGVQGAIATRADAEFEKLDAAQKDAARRMLIQMVRPGEERRIPGSGHPSDRE